MKRRAAGLSPTTQHGCAAFSRSGGSAAKATGFSPATQHSCAAFSRSGGSAAKATGFTLIEVLLATTLLAAGLALAFATLHAATATANRGEALAQRSERMRAVESFLRARLTAARPVAFATDQESGLGQHFFGDARRMRFVADLPDYLGRGGPYLHEFAIQANGNQLRLTADLTLVQGGTPIPESRPRPPELLVDRLGTVRFRYRALDADNRPGPWLELWPTGEKLPLQVEIALRDADGYAWPPLVVALPLAGNDAGATGLRR